SEIHTWLAETDRIPLQQDINNAIGYQARTGKRLLPQDYDKYESNFFPWAGLQGIATNQTIAGNDFSSSASVLSELTQGTTNKTEVPFADKINYLTQIASKLFGVRIGTSGRLPNPNDWVFSANAYAQ